MKVSTSDIQDQVKSVKITIEKDDYLPTFEKELKKLKQTAQLKGFRKGKTPTSVIKKYYGDGALAKIVSDLIEKNLGKALEDEKLENIVQPVLAEDSPQHEFSSFDLKDYDFHFEVPVFKDLTIKGVSESDSILKHKVEVDDKIVDDEFQVIRRKAGENVKIEKEIQEKDYVTFFAKEIDEKGKEIKDGWETGFSVLANTLTDEYKEQIIGKDVGFEIDFDIYELEANRDEKYVKKYLLNLDEEEEKEIGKNFKGEVKEISRLEPAKVDEDFFAKVFPDGEVKSEEEAKEKIKENISNYYEEQSQAFLRRGLMDKLIEENELTLPEDYLKKYLLDSVEELTAEKLDDEFDAYKENVRWEAIKGKLNEEYALTANYDEVRAQMEGRIRSMLGGQAGGMDLTPFIENMMQNQQELQNAFREVVGRKILDKVAENITLQEESISIEKFGELVAELNEKLNN